MQSISKPHQHHPTPELDAYKKVVRCFMQGPYDLSKEEALATLRQVLRISNDAHLRVRRELKEELGGRAAGQGEAQQAQQGSGPCRGDQREQHPVLMMAGGQGALDGSAAAAAHSPPSPSYALSSHHPSPFSPHQAARLRGSKAGAKAGKAAGSSARKRPKAAPPGPSGQGQAQQAPPPAQPRQQHSALEVHPLVGRRVLRYWPQDGGWFEGLVSAYRPSTGEHCIVYDFGLPSESYEWYKLKRAPSSEFQLATDGGQAPNVTALLGLDPAAAVPQECGNGRQRQQGAGGGDWSGGRGGVAGGGLQPGGGGGWAAPLSGYMASPFAVAGVSGGVWEGGSRRRLSRDCWSSEEEGSEGEE